MKKSNIFKQIERLKKIILDSHKVAFYPSSGTNINILKFSNIPVDFVICSDYNHNREIQQGKIITIKADNNLCLRIIIESGIKLDSIFAIQDGAIDGGNYEWVNSVGFLGRALPALNDRFILVNNEHYESYTSFDKGPVKNLGSNIKTDTYKLGKYSTYAPITNNYKIEEYEKEYYEAIQPYNSEHPQIIIKRKSIWEDIEQLDAVFINTKTDNNFKTSLTNYWPDIFKPNKIYDLQDFSTGDAIQSLLDFANSKQFETIGLTPMAYYNNRHLRMNDFYKEVYQLITTWNYVFPKKVIFYHFDKNDYQYLYNAING